MMQSPVEITFRGMSPSPAVEEAIQRSVSHLEQSYDRALSCTVIVEVPHHHRQRGNLFHVRVELRVPGLEIEVSRDAARDQRHEDVYVALSDAFRAAERQLQDHLQIRRGDIKSHSV